MDFLNDYFKFNNGIVISGLTKELNCFYVLRLFELHDESVIVVTNSLYEANIFYNLLQTYTNEILLFPMDDFLTSMIVAESPEFRFTRLESLKQLKEGKKIIITNLTGYLKLLPSALINYELRLKVNGIYKRESITSRFIELGYKKESIVTSTGEYAIRGCIIDIFPINEKRPIRIEFFGDNIESIRYFDESTQMSLKEIQSVVISPINEIIDDNNSSLLDYTKGPVVFIDYDQINAAYLKLETDIFEYETENMISKKLMFSLNELKPKYVTYLNIIGTSFEHNALIYNTKEIDNYNMDFEKLKDDIYRYQKSGKEIIICCSKNNQFKVLKDLNINARFINKKINHGFILDKYVVIGENDLENNSHYTEKYKSSYRFGKRIKDYNQLEIGDYVVHISHGIGVYNGLVALSKNGVRKDYLQILYAGNDKIYVPVEKITTIYKYGDKDGATPKINRLNSGSWPKTKSYITSKIKDISANLIKLYKERLQIHNDPYIEYPELQVFNESFEYELTSDQQKSIKDIFLDLESNHPMDRLLCGDVGFGKTEVAFRAMFETVLNNKQVMYLCPTTILSKQQYEVALRRFSEWPISIAILNRFVSQSETKRVIEGLKAGKIDIVFGTHRLLSGDITFKNLGLLVIDEEQRFGVNHKEKIKELKKDVNVLTLSATPIPRTLKMALSGIRDLSIIDTPPVDRYPVQTYVIKEDEWLIKDAIYKELSRNGQVFILYNYVESIEKKAEKLRSLVPDGNIKYAHGQMRKEELERIMDAFVRHEFDILLCTTIIESGIDIPNSNTLIVYDSDRFGLSQLYQMRGRVGRSNKIAYCYLLYQPNKVLNETAVKRLEAIKEFTELGSGYKIAMRDLSIRGAGDIFGSSQAGFVDSVGISLYMKMIDDEVKRQKGETVEDDEEEPQALLNIETHISDTYVSDENVKIEIHQRINEIDSEEKFQEIKAELEDRFGKITNQIEAYMYEEWFEALAKKYGITKVTQTDRLVQIEFPEDLSNKISGDRLLISAFQLSKNFNLKYEHNKIYITLYIKNLTEHFIVYLVKLLNSLELKSE